MKSELIYLHANKFVLLSLVTIFLSSVSLFGGEGEQKTLKLEVRVGALIAVSHSDETSFALDLVQEADKNAQLSIYPFKKDNANQSFVLIPTGLNEYYICARKTGRILSLAPCGEHKNVNLLKGGYDSSRGNYWFYYNFRFHPGKPKSEYFPLGMFKTKEDKLKLSSTYFDSTKPNRWKLQKFEGGGAAFMLQNTETGLFLGCDRKRIPNINGYDHSQYYVICLSEKYPNFDNMVLKFELKPTKTMTYLFSPEKILPKVLDPPDLTSLNSADLCKETEPVTTGMEIIPYFLVSDDPLYPKASQQVKHSPVYLRKFYESWQRIETKEYSGAAAKKIEITTEISFKVRQYEKTKLSKTSSNTITHKTEVVKVEEEASYSTHGSATLLFGQLGAKASYTTKGSCQSVNVSHNDEMVNAQQHIVNEMREASVQEEKSISQKVITTLTLEKGDKTLYTIWIKKEGCQLYAIEGANLTPTREVYDVSYLNKKFVLEKSFTERE